VHDERFVARRAADAAEGIEMQSQGKEGGSEPAFCLVPPSKGKTVVGVAALLAASSFAFMVFGPTADPRALALVGDVEGGVAVVPVAASAPRVDARHSPISWPMFVLAL